MHLNVFDLDAIKIYTSCITSFRDKFHEILFEAEDLFNRLSSSIKVTFAKSIDFMSSKLSISESTIQKLESEVKQLNKANEVLKSRLENQNPNITQSINEKLDVLEQY